ncbi:MAG: GNAT family N-acetyltransferase [Legionellales bacterium]|nr:GNAT family N-acetyltransferase [Legionellales bacterium]
MSVRNIVFHLGKEYKIKAKHTDKQVEVMLIYNEESIGNALLTTDFIDVGCITQINLADEHVDVCLDGQHTLGEAFLKFLFKFPLMPRKIEFRFITCVPKNLESVTAKYHYAHIIDSEFKNDILLRRDFSQMPTKIILPENIVTRQNVLPKELPALLNLLRNNAYWQEHLIEERLNILVTNSCCFVALEGEKLVGFARVLTDGNAFASLWDVVVDENYRSRGIGTSLMQTVFSCENFKNINTFILFTDTAKPLYQKFGFVSEVESEEKSNMMHKFRLQDKHPRDMAELIHIMTQNADDICLSAPKSLAFLFGEPGKRAQHIQFWQKELAIIPEKISDDKHQQLSQNFG